LNEVIFDLIEVEVHADLIVLEELAETLWDVANAKLNLPNAIGVAERHVLLRLVQAFVAGRRRCSNETWTTNIRA
jgi:hypothetical protein